MRKNGVPKDQIIHLSYDDVANNSMNPFPGKLFNKPTPAGTPGVDVYADCVIDYSGTDTTAVNVIGVLTGDDSIAGPVLKSDENSEVFFYFADHGAPGLIAMPTGGYLYADAFNAALEKMNAQKMYKQMTVYIEACESGSMFENILKTNLNIYAVSAANSHESSWGTYCSPDDKVDGKSLNSCLGDLFSVNWMEDADKANMRKETLQEQYETVKTETTKSHVLQWGEVDWTTEPIGMFESIVDAPAKKSFWKSLRHFGKNAIKDIVHWDEAASEKKNDFAVDSRDIQLHYLYNLVMTNPSAENNAALQAEISHRMKMDKLFSDLFPMHMDAVKSNSTPLPTDFDCYRTLIETFESQCEKIDDYTLKYMKAFVAECEGMKSFPEKINQTVDNIT
jgi:legumain